ncbi:MAG: putative type II secretion system protein E [Verrucomicrobiae bacterium]|nr:putative type II secretion system protein E [Verrucomicrobiae bacterium]
MKQKPTAELLEMDQAIALLKTTRPTFYRWLRAGKLKGMKVGRQWRFHRDDIERFLKGEQPRIDLPISVEPLITSLETQLQKLGAETPPKSTENTTVQAVNLMVQLAVCSHASDIHLAPQQSQEHPKGGVSVRFRIDGVLQPVAQFDIRLLGPIIEQWKIMAGCDLHERERPQDGRIMLRLDERQVDLRVSFLPTLLGESLTARVLSRDQAAVTLERFDLAPHNRDRLLRGLESPAGLILLTGPTGSGKTTTLYACLTQVNTPARKIVSIEDPVEYLLPGVVQVPVRQNTGMTFAAAARALLRSDADVILIGEIRDNDTLQVCFQAALTGRLVLSAMHTDEAATALIRMVDIGALPYLVTDATKLIVAQRLVRRLCPDCSVAESLTPEIADRVRQLAQAGGLVWEELPQDYRREVGCPKCLRTGFRGRTVIVEVLEVSPEIADALQQGASPSELRAVAIRQGMTTMVADGLAKAARGVTTIDEVVRVCGVR